MTSQKGKPQPHYSEAFKAKAVARLYSEGYPDKSGALRKIADELDVTHPTLARWAKGGKAAPDTEVIRQAVFAMEAVLEAEIEKILEQMDKVREKADYRALAIALGIIFDKYQLLRGAPTSRSERVLHDMRSRSNEDLENVIQRAEELAQDAFDRAGDTTPSSGSGAGSESVSKS